MKSEKEIEGRIKNLRGTRLGTSDPALSKILQIEISELDWVLE